MAGYLPTADVFGSDPYPAPGGTMWLPMKWMRQKNKGASGTRAIWQVTQAFDKGAYHPAGSAAAKASKMPSEQEMRCMIWQNLASGANGILLYSFIDLKKMDWKTPFKDTWATVCRLGYEVKRHENVFLTDEGKARARILVKDSIARFPEAEVYCADFINVCLDLLEKIKTVKLFLSTKSVLILANEMLEKYHNYKKVHSKLDYNDLIVITKKMFEEPKVAEWILYKLDGGIDNVLIDEAQDTSPEQWAIVKAITKEFFSGKGSHEKEPTVFVVGDRKQSIYSFQGADPAEFEKMHKYFEAESSNFKTVNMEVSFRSTAAVLDTVNVVFDFDKAKKGVVPENQNIKHAPSRIGDGGRVELWELVEQEDDDNNDKIWLPPVERIGVVSPSARLANKIAEMIKEKVTRGDVLKSKGRPLQYGDSLILVQRRTAFVEEMVRACKNIGVNISGIDKLKLLEQLAVQDLLSLANFLLLPQDDLSLAEVLKSPLFGLTDDDLFELCYNRKNDSLWHRLKQNSKYESPQMKWLQLNEADIVTASGDNYFKWDWQGSNSSDDGYLFG
jgi:ATP-dependent helicase/nuclease subunit A